MSTENTIVTIKRLEEVSQYLEKQTLLLLDIDDTLITGHHRDGDPNKAFRDALIHYPKPHRYCHKPYIELVKAYNTSITTSSWNLTQPNLPKLFKEWTKSTTAVFGFTGRGLEIARETQNTLQNLRINFRRRENGNPYMIPNITGRSGQHSKHIIYCGGYNKGQVLDWLLANDLGFCIQLAEHSPIVMVDDQLSNLQSIHYMCTRNRLPFTGLLYEI